MTTRLYCTLRVAWILLQHPLELLARHRPAGSLAPLRLGAGDELGSQALVEAPTTLLCIVGRKLGLHVDRLPVARHATITQCPATPTPSASTKRVERRAETA